LRQLHTAFISTTTLMIGCCCCVLTCCGGGSASALICWPSASFCCSATCGSCPRGGLVARIDVG
jgi:hypothetical protein